MHTTPILKALRSIALVAGLLLGAVAPEASSTLLIVIGILALFALRRPHLALLRRPGIWMTLVAVLLLAVGFGLGAQSPSGALGIVYVVPVLLMTPLLALVRVDNAENGSLPIHFATFCLVGVGGAATVAIYEHFALGVGRAGASVANPIHFADLAVAMGFFSLIGLFSPPRPVRLMFLFGPVLAFVAVWLSGSRGPLLAFAVLLVAVLIAWLRWSGVTRRNALLLCIALVAVAAVGATYLYTNPTVLAELATTITTTLRAGDTSSQQRLVMYQGALGAFLASPIWGYGPFDFVHAAARFGPPGVDFPVYGHLHNDIADFATSGGLIGLVGLVLLLVAPLVEALSVPAGLARRPALLGAIVISLGYLTMGLTNAMFGIMMLTVFFAFGSLVVSQLARPD